MVHEQKNAAATKRFAAMKIAPVRQFYRRIRVESLQNINGRQE